MNLDLSIIIFYLLGMLGTTFWLGKKISLIEFFVNNRNTSSILLIFSIVSTAIGAGAVVGLAGAAYKTGISYGISLLITAISGYLILAWLAPKIKEYADSRGAFTLGDYLKEKYSLRTQYLASVITIIVFFIFSGAQFVALASLIHVLIGINFIVALFVTAGLTILYTDFVQFSVMILAFGLAFLPFGILKNGIPRNLPMEHFDIFNFAGPLFFFGSILLGGLYVIASMDFWQRIYAARSPKQIRKVFLWSALISIPFYLLPIGLGLIAFSRFGPGLDPNLALFKIMKETLPTGILGLGYAGLIAAIMSSVDSSILVSASSAVRDFYQPLINPSAGIKETRYFVLIFGLASLVTAYFIPDIVSLVLLAIFLLVGMVLPVLGSIFLVKPNERAAFWSMLLSTATLLIFLPISFEIAWVPAFLVSVVTFIGWSIFENKKQRII